MDLKVVSNKQSARKFLRFTPEAEATMVFTLFSSILKRNLFFFCVGEYSDIHICSTSTHGSYHRKDGLFQKTCLLVYLDLLKLSSLAFTSANSPSPASCATDSMLILSRPLFFGFSVTTICETKSAFLYHSSL